MATYIKQINETISVLEAQKQDYLEERRAVTKEHFGPRAVWAKRTPAEKKLIRSLVAAKLNV